MSGHFEFLDGFPPDVVAVSAQGKIDRHAYEETLLPLIAERIKVEGKIKLFYVIGSGFDGYTLGAAWDDTKLGFSHMGKFARIAVVTDTEWIRMGVQMFSPMIACPLRLFHMAQMPEAREWISSDDTEKGAAKEVAASHKLATMEDMMPPEG